MNGHDYPNGTRARKFKWWYAPTIALVALLGGVAGWQLRTVTPSVYGTGGSGPLRVSDPRYNLISPLLACSIEAREFPGFKPLEAKINNLIDQSVYNGSAKTVSVYFREMNRGRWVGVNENEKYFPASLLKVPLMMAYFRLSDTSPDILQKKIYYDGSFDDNAKETIKPEKSIEPKRWYTTDDLIASMIKYSDNNATHLLFNTIDTDSLDEVYTDLQLPVPHNTDDTDFVSVKAYSYFFRILYNATYLSRSASEKALQLLTYPGFPQGIQAGVPASIPIAEKFGEGALENSAGNGMIRELHDCGIVYYPGNPYLICVMTRGNDLGALADVIRNISELVYGEVSSPNHVSRQF